MKNVFQTTLVLCLVIAAMVIIPTAAMAAGAPPKTPIDGGLSVLLAAGGIYAVKELRKKRTNS